MADPVTMIGLVAGLITFVDFGYKVVLGTKSVRGSLTGTTPEMAELDLIIEDIRALNDAIRKAKPQNGSLTDDEARILAMVRESEELYNQMRRALDKLKVRVDARSKTIESGRVALQSLRSHSELQDLTKRLTSLDQRIRSSVEYALRRGQTRSIMSKLGEMQAAQRKLGIKYESKLDGIREDILHLIQQQHQDGKAQLSIQTEALAQLKLELCNLQKEHKLASKHVRVIRSLYFQEVRRRFDQIPVADRRSNKWIFDAHLTTFTSWLEGSGEDDGIFYIWGRAGSGKSTLMKYISENERMYKSLNTWTKGARLYTGNYFFWNQGNNMQKSRTGLMQSLLYQILRSAPELIDSVCEDRLEHEVWQVEHLITTFKRIAMQTKLNSKFCFFIDGLDEYNGDESDIVPMLEVLSASPHMKVCASSRPGRVYERSLRRNERAFDIAQFTRDDMRVYALTRLQSNFKFSELALHEPECQTVISNISNYANGVWLWVFLVTRDILHEVDRDEGIGTLQKIVNEFPSDLEKYFERIIAKIKARHKEEMAQTFLVTVHALQPLPLYAFALLQEERSNPDYALGAPVQHILNEDLEPRYPIWRSRVQNRCGDLLVVDDKSPLLFLSHAVDFLHRTVRDFLGDCYHDQLNGCLKMHFNPLLSLCKIHLAMLKALPIDDFADRTSVNQIIGLTDDMLYYAHEASKDSNADEDKTMEALLDELDVVNTHHARNMRSHWTHARDSPVSPGYDVYREGGRCNFLALVVQSGLVKYVRAKLQSEPHRIKKAGRPLLDYALRPLRVTRISMDYHSAREDPGVNLEMVELLLEFGADPNEAVHLYDGETVWALFLISIGQTARSPARSDLGIRTWYRTCEALVAAGAQSNRNITLVNESLNFTTVTILNQVFSSSDAGALMKRIEEMALEREQATKTCGIM